MKKILTICALMMSVSAFAETKEEHFRTTYQVVAEMLIRGQIEGETPEKVFRLTMLTFGVTINCYDRRFEDMDYSCIKNECRGEMCPKVDMVAIGRFVGGQLVGYACGEMIGHARREVVRRYEEFDRETRERVRRERAENERLERCATAAPGSGLTYGCDK